MLDLKSKYNFFSTWVVYVVRNFMTDQCLLRASALTYATALSIVPFLAVAFSISKGFGFQNTEYIRNFLLKISAGRENVVEHIINYINRTDVGTLGAIGVAILLITVFTLLGTIERSFNTIWGVKFQRAFSRKFADYLSVTLVCPLLILVAISFTASLESYVIVQKILSFFLFNYAYLAFLKLLPFILVITALFFMYKFIPNTRISIKSALIGSIVAGVLWQLSQKLWITYQIGVSKYNAIYGSFAQLPLFLVWLYVSWIIILFGSEVGSALENFEGESTESTLGEFNLEFKEQLALAVMTVIVRDFERGKGYSTAEQLHMELNLPMKIINQIFYVLIQTGFLITVYKDREEGVALGRSPVSCSCVEFIRKFRAYKEENSAHWIDEKSGFIVKVFDELYKDAARSKKNLSLSELARETPYYR